MSVVFLALFCLRGASSLVVFTLLGHSGPTRVRSVKTLTGVNKHISQFLPRFAGEIEWPQRLE